MPNAHQLSIFVLAVVALCLTPGPDMLFVIASTLRRGARAGLLSALGISAAMLVHTTAAALGLAYLFARSAVAFEVVRWLGAVYLIVLGLRALRQPLSVDHIAAVEPSTAAIIRQGFLTNLLNPKVILFFAAFLPQFVTPGAGSVASQFVVLGILFTAIGLCIDSGVAVVSSLTRRVLPQGGRASRLFSRLSGMVFIGLGLRLLTLSRSS